MYDGKPHLSAADNDNDNEDWLRSMAWDFPPMDSAEDFEQLIHPMTLSHFMDLPAAKAMPARLKRQVKQYLRSGASTRNGVV